MTDEQKRAIEHAQKILRAVKLYEYAAGLDEGWRLVPIAPTVEMIVAIENQIDSQLTASGMDPRHMFRQDGEYVYEAMLAATRAPSVADVAEAIRTHTTQPGESVMGIALRQCGNEAAWRHILACNPKFASMLPHEYFPVGTVLTLPPDAAGASEGQA